MRTHFFRSYNSLGLPLPFEHSTPACFMLKTHSDKVWLVLASMARSQRLDLRTTLDPASSLLPITLRHTYLAGFGGATVGNLSPSTVLKCRPSAHFTQLIYLCPGEHLGVLRGAGLLRELNLRGCYKVADAGLQGLGRLHSLTALNLQECWQITQAGLKHLSGAHPGVYRM